MLQKYSIEDARIDPQISLIANDNWMEFTARYVVDFKQRRSTKDHIFTDIVAAIEQTDGQVGIASTTLQLVDLPHVKLDMSNRSAQP